MKLSEQNLDLIKLFLKYVIEQLDIKTNATIKLLNEHNPEYPSAGGYLPDEKIVLVAVKNRAIADVLRTIAHELTHHKQNENRELTPNDTDNQELEDSANVMAARCVRYFGRVNKEIYNDLI